MPLKPVEKPLKMEKNRKEGEKPNHRRASGNFPKKKDKFGRKRSQSFSGGNGKFCAPYKCRRRPMLPTKFLLGGNICDPLNLNSLQDEEINRTVNAVTPKSSPIPTPPQRRGHIEVIIPPNIHDPLNLIDCNDDFEYEQQLTSPVKKGNKRRKKKKRTSSATTEISDADISSASEAKTPDISSDSAKIPEIETSVTENSSPPAKLLKVTKDLRLELSPQKDKKRKSDGHGKEGVKKLRRMDSMDKIVSPVVPQPGAWMKRPVQFNRGPGTSGKAHTRTGKKENINETLKMPDFKQKNKAFQYGNYNRYYGYRNLHHEVDPRLKCFAAYRHLFIGKDILDIGCNIGHITLSIARDFGAKSIVGLDIDKKLIGIARKNIRHYVNCSDSPREDSHDQPGHSSDMEVHNDKFFPISMPILYGPVDVPGINDERKGKGFPHNVTFVQGNYVLEDDALLATDQTQFDIILCLSVTKWMHLNWGDAGLKQAFRRMYVQLRPGGKLILEPQSWASYKHKKQLTETIYKNYHTVEFFPEKFTQYLLSSEVGFAKSEVMGHPHHLSKGFQRPIQIFTKSDLSPSQSQRSYTATPSHTITSTSISKQVYTSITTPDTVTEQSYAASKKQVYTGGLITSPERPVFAEEKEKKAVACSTTSTKEESASNLNLNNKSLKTSSMVEQVCESSVATIECKSSSGRLKETVSCVHSCSSVTKSEKDKPSKNNFVVPTSTYEENYVCSTSHTKNATKSVTISSTKRKFSTLENDYSSVDIITSTSEDSQKCSKLPKLKNHCKSKRNHFSKLTSSNNSKVERDNCKASEETNSNHEQSQQSFKITPNSHIDTSSRKDDHNQSESNTVATPVLQVSTCPASQLTNERNGSEATPLANSKQAYTCLNAVLREGVTETVENGAKTFTCSSHAQKKNNNSISVNEAMKQRYDQKDTTGESLNDDGLDNT